MKKQLCTLSDMVWETITGVDTDCGPDWNIVKSHIVLPTNQIDRHVRVLLFEPGESSG